MKKLLFFLLFSPALVISQSLDSLTVEKIMRDPIWIGSSPSNPFWSSNGQKLYFNWNPDKEKADSLYSISLTNRQPEKVTISETHRVRAENNGRWNKEQTQRVFISGNTLYLRDVSSNSLTALVQTTENISQPVFINDGKSIAYRKGNNLYAIQLANGSQTQLTHFVSGNEPKEKDDSDQKTFIKDDALKNSEILKQRKAKAEQQKELQKIGQFSPEPIYLGKKSLMSLAPSPDGKYVFYQLTNKEVSLPTDVPNYVTLSGETENLIARPKVGSEKIEYTAYIYHRDSQESIPIETSNIPGIKDIPAFYKDYPEKYEALKKDPPQRDVSFSTPIWNPKGDLAVLVINALDHKDRWIMLLNFNNGQLELLDRQRDEAWIGGPGISGYAFNPGNIGWIDKATIWFQSEESGYSHLYTLETSSKRKTALTQGNYEVQKAELSKDGKTFFITTNEVTPGEPNFYTLDLKSKKTTRITQAEGGHNTVVSPDEKKIAFLHSTSNRPWELFVQDNKSNAQPQQITDKATSDEFKSYPWRKPEIISFTNRDGKKVYAEVYQPHKQAESKPGAIFVHGAGYLQDVKNYWSDSYFREHMFMNLLADHGYTVMNIDYQASSGYGRDWRTAIYRHMGDKDLNDQVDGAKFMVDNYDVNPDKIGIWGGSYGGFITLMALFKTDAFAAGAALRSVTDWAHYNHGYTSNILNLPQNDPLAYHRSSPINFAEDFKGHLLMPHGMIDVNVHFQDIVRLTQRLIELGKDNWELAVYPLEDHGFVEPSSWTDEYKRIFKLFETHLK